jgi:hypothetical protein
VKVVIKIRSRWLVKLAVATMAICGGCHAADAIPKLDEPDAGVLELSAARGIAETCAASEACTAGLTWETYYGIAGPEGPQLKTCELRCTTDVAGSEPVSGRPDLTLLHERDATGDWATVLDGRLTELSSSISPPS